MPAAGLAGAFSRFMQPNVSAAVAGVALLFVVVTILRALMTRASSSKGILVRTYDPATRTWRDMEVSEVSPGIYVDRDRRHLVLVPTEATPDYVEGKRRYRVYTAVKLGNFVGYVEPVKGVTLALARQSLGEGQPGLPFHRFVRRLYELGLLPARLGLRPDVDLYIYMDGKELAKMASDTYGVNASKAIMSVSDMTGQVTEFLEMLDKLAEYERKRAESLSKIFIAIGVVIMIAGLVAIIAMGGGGH